MFPDSPTTHKSDGKVLSGREKDPGERPGTPLIILGLWVAVRNILMNLAKVSPNGQITVPIEIRRKLKIKEGDKIIFLERPSGEIVLQNSSVFALRQAQTKLSGIETSENKLLQDVMDIRYGNSQFL
jgi:antitoxin PrlF